MNVREILPGILTCPNEPGLRQDVEDIPEVVFTHEADAWLIIYCKPGDESRVKAEIEALLGAEVPAAFWSD